MNVKALQTSFVPVQRDNSIRRIVTVFKKLFFIRWANIRNEWYFHLLGAIYPLGILAFMKMAGAVTDSQKALYVTAGNAIVALVLGPMQSLANDLAWGKQRNELEYYSTLPFSKALLILAFVSVSAIATIPAIVITITVGSLWLGFPVSLNLLVVPIVLLAIVSMAGLGAAIGVYSRNGHHANMMNSLTLVLVTFLSPVIIPVENLPLPLQYTAKILPTSYAANAFRAALAGRTDMAVIWDILILAGFAVVTMTFAVKQLDWRVE